MQLRDDNSFCTVVNERTRLGHEGNISQINDLLLDRRHFSLLIAIFSVSNVIKNQTYNNF